MMVAICISINRMFEEKSISEDWAEFFKET